MVIIDLPRSSRGNKVYEAIESLKDGIITSQKYRGKTIVFNSPHVVVFSNREPDRKKLSADRWDIRYIDETGYHRVPYNPTRGDDPRRGNGDTVNPLPAGVRRESE
jgi:hypothetical protein